MSDTTPHPGSCLCGAVAFTATGPLRDVLGCHCSQCRKTSGHYWAATSVPLERFEITTDEGLVWFRSSATAERGFCRRCGASLFWKPEGEGRMAIAPGAFDDAPPFTLSGHIFTEDAGDYYAPDGPPPTPGPEQADLSCGCLCGDVAFSVSGPAGEVWACHCDQCRKLSGHYSASFDADEATLRYRAKRNLSEYRTPGGGTRGFCSGCGSSLWFRSADGEFSVEAGCVDGPTGGQLARHIFTDSKGAYYAIDDGLPQE
ncbi:GFA family protein [Frigidibacter sp. RF13]|uniref:GFA family protein n=1 Tax=Frigidibacter sp. RF13 TaxID=2997340 RepID=UPI002D1E4267|nr:GFA family protein [Frigidibacter sp. RF13]